MSTTNKEPIWTVRFILVIIMAMFSGLAAQLTYPLVARFSLTLDPDITLAGTIAGLMSLMSLFVCPFAGLLSDIRTGTIAPGSDVLFVHTGGATVFFAEKEIVGQF